MKTQLLTTLENARNYTLGVAAAMPAKNYDFKPAPEVFSFGELLHHIGYGIGWWEENFIRQQSSGWNPPVPVSGKEATMSYLDGAFAALKESVEKNATTDKAIAGFYATIDHITHHRGQATTYLRCRGIVPPEYIY